MLRRTTLAAVAATIALSAAACGSATETPAAAPQTTAQAAATPAAKAAAKISANTATEDQITAALRGAGVSNPGHWAEEVMEYRPYDSTDTNMDRLRQKLAKYNPGADTMSKILSVLQP